jgi:F0F1-type ATP synthase alpha subunit
MSCSEEDIEAATALLRRKDAMTYTTVVAAPGAASLGERYAAVSAACSLGERVRDRGGHALVVIDDLACMVRDALLKLAVRTWPALWDPLHVLSMQVHWKRMP